MGQDREDWQSENKVEIKSHSLFDSLKIQDMRNERRIFWSELAILLGCGLFITAYLIALAIDQGTVRWPWP